MLIIGLMAISSDILIEWDEKSIITVLAGLFFAEITKYLNNGQ